VSDFTLTPRAPLGGYARPFDGTTLSEVTGLALVSVATPLGGDARLHEALSNAYGASYPAPGTSSLSADGTVRFLGLQRDQVFTLFPHDGDDAAESVAARLGDAAYFTDQSDGWAMLRLSGEQSHAALERICMLDLAPDRFVVGAVARTLMEHLGVILLREDTDTFLLMSARSSARSFLHAVETSAVNVS